MGSTDETTGSQDKNVNENFKRQDYLPWDDFFMATAFLIAKRSKDPVTQVGAVIVNQDKKIVATGYNGMPNGCHDDEFPWSKDSEDPLNSKHSYVCHAEMNAVLNKNSADVKNCKMYVGLFPCNECAKIIIQSGIREVIYMSDKHHHKTTTIAAKRMFDAAKVTYTHYEPKVPQVVIDFQEINWSTQAQHPSTPRKKQNTLSVPDVESILITKKLNLDHN